MFIYLCNHFILFVERCSASALLKTKVQTFIEVYELIPNGTLYKSTNDTRNLIYKQNYFMGNNFLL